MATSVVVHPSGSPGAKSVVATTKFDPEMEIKMLQTRISRSKAKIGEEEERAKRLRKGLRMIGILREKGLSNVNAKVGVIVLEKVLQFLGIEQGENGIKLARERITEKEAVLRQIGQLIQEKQSSILGLQGQVEDLACIKERLVNDAKMKRPGCGLYLTCLGSQKQSREEKQIPPISGPGEPDPTKLLQNLKQIRDDLHEAHQKEKESRLETRSLKLSITSARG